MRKNREGILKNILFVGFCLGLMTGCHLSQPQTVVDFKEISFKDDDRILVLAPHPDDEVLGAGGIIQKANALKLPLKVVFLTYGDNNEWSFLLYRKHPVFMPASVRTMGLIRHDEAQEADHVLGLLPEQQVFLGYPDFRVIQIWSSHWGSRPPAKSMLSEVNKVPYANAFRPGAFYKGEEVLKDLEAVLREFKPTKVFVSHPADHNGDHQALYLFTRVALWTLEKEIKPEVYPYLIHFKAWPVPKGNHPKEKIEPPAIIQDRISWQSLDLPEDVVARKINALKKHHSQYMASPEYLLSFVRSNEMFGDFPVVRIGKDQTGSLSSQKGEEQVPEELTPQERATYVGFEERTVGLKDDHLVLTIKLSRSVAKTVGVGINIFGFREDKPFDQMPKIKIVFGTVGHSVFDQDKKLNDSSVKINRENKVITIKVPLDLLGNPQRIITNAHTYLGTVPLDWDAWRVVEIVK